MAEHRSERAVDGRERAILWCLWSVRGVRHGHIADLRREVALEAWWEAGETAAREELARTDLGSSALGSAMDLRDEIEDPLAAYRRECDRLADRASLLHVDDGAYPSRLFLLDEPPEFLYVRGEVGVLEHPRTVAAVGSRRIDVEDARRASRIVQRLGRAGVSVVSGGALGTDAVLHEGCLEAGAPTVVVLPSALDEPTPKRNLELFGRAAEQGAVVSEYPLGVELRNYHFPRRNRLIAALGDVTFIVRCDPDSGTMLTAEAADDLDRPMCALLGGLEEPLAEGCLNLIVDGTQAVRGAEDILDIYFPNREPASQSNPDPACETDADSAPPAGAKAGKAGVPDPADLDDVSDEAARLLEAARSVEPSEAGAYHVDVLDEATSLGARGIQSALLELELRGICQKLPGAQAYSFEAVSGRRV